MFISLKTKKIILAVVILIIITVVLFIYLMPKSNLGCYLSNDILDGFVWALPKTQKDPTQLLPNGINPKNLADLKMMWNSGNLMLFNKTTPTINAFPDYKYVSITVSGGGDYYYLFSKNPPYEKKINNSMCANFGFSDIISGAKSNSAANQINKLIQPGTVSWYVYDLSQ